MLVVRCFGRKDLIQYRLINEDISPIATSSKEHSMRPKKPFTASMDQVKISRQGEAAVIEYADSSVSVTHLTIGSEIATMSDVDILNLHNSVLEKQAELARNYEHVAVEIPYGKPQIEYYELCGPMDSKRRCLKVHH